MITNSPAWYLIFLGLGAILLELILGVALGFDLVLLGLALVIGGVVGIILTSWQMGLLVAAILAGAYVLFGRKLVKAKLAIKTTTTNVDDLVGKTGTVVKSVDPDDGQVKVGTELWRAQLDETAIDSLAKGEKINVVGVEGVTLRVKKV